MATSQASAFQELIASAIGMVLSSAVLPYVLIWRAGVRHNWQIPYRQAFVVTLKAYGAAWITTVVATIAFVLSGWHEAVATVVAMSLAVAAWFYAHNIGLHDIGDNVVGLCEDDYWALTRNTVACTFLIVLRMSLVLLVAVAAVSLVVFILK